MMPASLPPRAAAFSPRRVLYGALLGALALVFFASFLGAFLPPEEAAGTAAAVGAGILLVALAAEAILRGIAIPSDLALSAAGAVVLVALVSSVLSPAPLVSFLGLSLEPGTFVGTAALAVFLFAASAAVRDSRKAAGLSIAVLALALLLFGGEFAGWFGGGREGTLAGSWFNLGALAALIALLAARLLDLAALPRPTRSFAALVFLLALWLFGSHGFALLDWSVFLLSGGVLAFERLREPRAAAGRFTAALALAALAFLLVPPVAEFRDARSPVEVRPSPAVTLGMLRQATLESSRTALLGVGPNLFSSAWNRFRPEALNRSPLWNAEFPAGWSAALSRSATEGLLGGIAWLLLAGAGLWLSARSLRGNLAGRMLAPAVFLAWILVLFYVPSALVLVLAMTLTGALVGAAAPERESFPPLLSRTRAGAAALALVALSLALPVVFLAGSSLAAAVYRERGVSRFAAGESAAAETLLRRAVAVADRAAYRRDLAHLYLDRAQRIRAGTYAAEDPKKAFELAARSAIEEGKRATELNSRDPKNFLALGAIYRELAAVSVLGALEEARKAYERAFTLAPSDPLPRVLFAEALFVSGAIEEARGQALEALALKPDYTEAADLLRRIERQGAETP